MLCSTRARLARDRMVMQRWHRVALRRVSAPPASRFTHAHHLAHLRHTRRCCQGLLARRGNTVDARDHYQKAAMSQDPELREEALKALR